MSLSCSVCGGTSFADQQVLWPELIAQWGLSADEVAYIDRQQGTKCTGCGANLRIIVLGQAMQRLLASYPHPLRDIALEYARNEPGIPALRILDVNGAEAISDALSPMPGYERKTYPQIDMQAMTLASDTYDVVLHSDTLEHVPDPVAALRECRRVLKPGGTLVFTIPMIVGRMTRSRAGLPPSYHGASGVDAEDWRVQTEFGADAWTWLPRAGFSAVTIVSLQHPVAHAFVARKDLQQLDA